MKTVNHTWNHRLVLHNWSYDKNIADKMQPDQPTSGTWLGIHEVHYDNGVPCGCTVESNSVTGETLEDVQEYYKMMESALMKPVLLMSDFEPGGKYYGN